MTITYSPSLTNYDSLLQSFLKSIEGEESQPYVDGKGVPTIGLGFAINKSYGIPAGIEYVISVVLGVNNPSISGKLDAADYKQEAGFEQQIKSVLNQKWSPSDTSGLLSALGSILRARATAVASYSPADQALIGAPKTNLSMNVPQMAAYLKIIEPTVDSRLAASLGAATPGDTSEGVALFGIRYNGSISGLVKNALNLSNSDDARAAAWLAIRDSGTSQGTAKRAYQESAMFGLYGTDANDQAPATVSDVAALAADRVVSANRSSISTYDTTYASALSHANTAMLQNGLPAVQSLVQALQPAADTLNADFGHGQTFNSVDIGVSADSVIGATTVDFSVDINNDLMIGGFVNDTLEGGSGSNTYDYVATGANVTETIVNGSNNSAGTVWVGNTQIIGPGANATVSVNGLVQKETPRLCRGGSRSLTNPGVHP